MRSALLAGCALLVVAACARRAEPLFPPKHLLLVTVEDLRADRLSCYQNLVPTSRFDDTLEERIEGRAFGFDELARGGVVFARAYASSPSCRPSLAALHTGRSPIETGVLDDHDALPADCETLASVLSARGFETAAFVSGPRAEFAPISRAGFETFRAPGDDEATLAAAEAFFSRDTGDGRSTFVWIHLSALALPWDDALVPADGRRFVDPAYTGGADGSSAWLARLARGEVALEAADRDAFAARYDERLRATLDRLRAFLGRTYDWTTSPVEASEVWARTLFVFAGTNGFELGEHGALGAALSPHEEALRVPLLLRHPDSLTGERVVLELVTLEDVAPTVLDALDVRAPEDVDGRTLLDLLDDRARAQFPRRPAVAVLPGPVYSVRAEGLRAVWNRWASPPADGARHVPGVFALYDLGADPGELRDVFGVAAGTPERAHPAPTAVELVQRAPPSARTATERALGALEAWRAARSVGSSSRARDGAGRPLKP